MDQRQNPDTPTPPELLEIVARLEKIEERLVEVKRAFLGPTLGQKVLQGVATGFGTVVGATVVVALVVALLQPLKHMNVFGSQVERLITALERSNADDRR